MDLRHSGVDRYASLAGVPHQPTNYANAGLIDFGSDVEADSNDPSPDADMNNSGDGGSDGSMSSRGHEESSRRNHVVDYDNEGYYPLDTCSDASYETVDDGGVGEESYHRESPLVQLQQPANSLAADDPWLNDEVLPEDPTRYQPSFEDRTLMAQGR